MSAPWGLSNWGARDRDRYQAELDAIVASGEEAREHERMRRYRQWNEKHAAHEGDIVISMDDGAVCVRCGERFDG